MFGSVTALQGSHVTGKYRDRSMQHACFVLHASAAPGMRPGMLTPVTHEPLSDAGRRPLEAARAYRAYSKSRTHTAVGSYGRAVPRSIGPP